MEQAYSLVNYSGNKEYCSRLETTEIKKEYVKSFIKAITTGSLTSIFRVGFIDMKCKIVNSEIRKPLLKGIEECNALIGKLASDIEVFSELLKLWERCGNVKSFIRNEYTDYVLSIFFMYLYFMCPPKDFSIHLFRQQILDTMLVYCINRKFYKNTEWMADFVFCSVSCEQQLCTETPVLQYSQYSELHHMIKCQKESRNILAKEFLDGNIGKEYLSWYLDCYSEIKDFNDTLELVVEDMYENYIVTSFNCH